MKRITPLESQVQKKIIDYLELRGAMVARRNSGISFHENKKGRKYAIKLGTSGTPDLQVLYKGKYTNIEVKRYSSYQLSPSQKTMFQTIRKHGGVCIVLHNENWKSECDAIISPISP